MSRPQQLRAGGLVTVVLLSLWACTDGIVSPATDEQVGDDAISYGILSGQGIVYGSDRVLTGPVIQSGLGKVRRQVALTGAATTVERSVTANRVLNAGMASASAVSGNSAQEDRAQMHTSVINGRKYTSAYISEDTDDGRRLKRIYQFIDGKATSALVSSPV